jgi:Tol biopolymer transport system component
MRRLTPQSRQSRLRYRAVFANRLCNVSKSMPSKASFLPFVLVFLLSSIACTSCVNSDFKLPKSQAPLPADALVYAGTTVVTIIRSDGSGSKSIGGRQRPVPPDEEGNIYFPSISPDRRTIAFVSSVLAFVEDNEGRFQTQSYSVFLMSADGRENKHYEAGKYKLVWWPDGSGAYYCGRYVIGWFDFVKNEKDYLRLNDRGSIKSIALSPSGRQLAWCTKKKIEVGRVNKGKFLGSQRIVATLSNDTEWMEWVNESELLIIELEKTPFTFPNRNKPQETLTEELPYRSHIFRLNVETGRRASVYDSNPWIIDQNLSMSPDRRKAAFTEGTQVHDPSNPWGTWAKGEWPRGRIIDLEGGKVSDIPVSRPTANPHTLELNWSSP